MKVLNPTENINFKLFYITVFQEDPTSNTNAFDRHHLPQDNQRQQMSCWRMI